MIVGYCATATGFTDSRCPLY